MDEPKYLSTSKMARVLDINERWLRKQRENIFIEGIHYHYPRFFHDCRWNIAAMINWVEGEDASHISDRAKSILESLSA